ncbi:MAG: AAA family ATPase [Burkholderiales bacterium]
MYLEHFGLSEAPFRITPHTDFFFAGANRGATLDALLYAITHDEGIVKVSGEVGSGKTMLCRVLMERLPSHVEIIYLSNPSLSRDEILLSISDELKLDPGSERGTRVLRTIQEALIERYAAGRRVVVLIDEAHAMPRETLEEIRLLSNLEANRHKLLQIVLFGQPELDLLLNTSEMRQLKERITHGFRLEPLVRNDIRSYVDYRMRAAGYRGPNPFSAAAIRRIDAASKGLTRRINILADKSLLAAFAANTHSVGDREAKRAVADSDFYKPRANLGRVALIGGGIAGGIAIGYAMALAFSNSAPQHATLVAPSVFLESKSQVQASELPSSARRDDPQKSTAETDAQKSAIPAVRQETIATKDTEARTSQLASQSAESAMKSMPAPRKGENEENTPSGSGHAEFSTPKALGKRAQQRYTITQEWLNNAPGKDYSIQLITVPDNETARLESFLGRAQKLLPDQDLYVYSVKINGLQHYRVALGRYSNTQEVRDAMAALPADLKISNPYFRSVERMRSQNSQ